MIELELFGKKLLIVGDKLVVPGHAMEDERWTKSFQFFLKQHDIFRGEWFADARSQTWVGPCSEEDISKLRELAYIKK